MPPISKEKMPVVIQTSRDGLIRGEQHFTMEEARQLIAILELAADGCNMQERELCHRLASMLKAARVMI